MATSRPQSSSRTAPRVRPQGISLTPAGPSQGRAAALDADRKFEPGSYRDRNGAVFYREGRVYRGISEKALANWHRLKEAAFFEEMTASGRIVATREASIPAVEGWAGILEHDRIPFVSYPYEWTFGMLKDAALLHLELVLAALGEGMILKDSSAYNVQWQGTQPVFIDIPSFEAMADGEPWVGYRQFCELFLYPLMLQAYRGADFRPWLRGSLDGIPVGSFRSLFSARDFLRAGVLMHVVAQSALQRRYSDRPRNVRGSLAKAGFDRTLIVRNVEGLRKIISRLQPAGAKSMWADYATSHSYDDEEHAAKRDFVRRSAAHRSWQLVWDLGCNTGTFSRIAAEHAETVIAMDGDWVAVERLYQAQKAREDASKILPLVVNLADPSPSQGWLGQERKSLADRGRPELTLCLALIHHIVIGANVPMRSFLDWLTGLGTSLVIEWVGRDDEMVEILLMNKDDQYHDYNAQAFEALLSERFEIVRSQRLKGGKRTIHFALARG